MKPSLANAFRHEMEAARVAWRAGDLDAAFGFLERAHILGQRHLWPHVLTHLWMLRVGWRRRDGREIVGQILRLLATLPGALIGWVPAGNTGGANVSALRPMPMPAEFAHHFAGHGMGRRVVRRLAALVTVGVLALAGIVGAMEWRRAAFDRELNSGAAERAAPRVADLGSTRRLEIVPLVNWHAASPDLKTEPGVAYLVRTDHATVLFDLGYNARGDATPPLLHNMARLGVSMSEVNAVFISHRHRDHVGGAAAERTGAITFGDQRPDLAGKPLMSPADVSYPGARTVVIDRPRKLFEGVATTGPIARSLFMGPVDEQALVVHVEERGLVVIVGCGHQTVPRLLDRLAGAFAEPLYGVVGDFHYPVPEGRLRIAGLDAQRLFASGDGPFKPITMAEAQAELMLLDGLGLIALGGHDTSDEVIAWAAARFGERLRYVKVGQAIVIQGQ